MIHTLRVATLKGQYSRDEDITVRISTEQIYEPGDMKLELEVLTPDMSLLKEDSQLSSGFPLEIAITLPEDSYPGGWRGFSLVCRLYKDKELVAEGNTAFDLKDPEQRVIRYGFLSDFRTEDRQKMEASLDFLAEFHMTHVQYYDWTYRHHEYNGDTDVFFDTMGKEIDLTLVKDEIEGCSERGMFSLGYGAVYAAGEEYLHLNPSQALRDCEGIPYNLIDRFYIMDISPGSRWRECLMKQYLYAVKTVGFDGIHMDTYGFPKKAFVQNESEIHGVTLENDFPDLIEETRNTLGDQAQLIFNNVGNWPVSATGPAPQDAVYIEVWDPYDSYSHIRQIILSASEYGKPVILAAYLAPFRLEENHGGMRALYSALILQSIIVSLSASHLLLGEGGNALTQGYYNDYSPLRDDERSLLKTYYDFQVRCTDFFYNSDLVEISETHTAGENREYFFSGASVSADGRPGTVWTIVRESPGMKLISLINLCGQTDSIWNKGKEAPVNVENFTMQIPMDGVVDSIFYTSPELNSQTAEILPINKIRNERGPAVQVELKNLPLWSIVVVKQALEKNSHL
ncbi:MULTISPECIES: glycoside hydrolase family 66 protein [unclassified Oceanispirochaeta]|uniref:glycoside hydrolase family 66 protein n=1 Tax=unclassified Oceanispirochaeta TaxID=2635722 RepID=UPI000E09CDAE|nr:MULTISPECIES: glycoside hydrolase family 66 protein [unclassified Oceanispirochaeta]MBF9018005.1 glycoside hydrolase family 66 protein [Oceanispirochaeta sp. M2]NPD74517.1 hypothetical protein [Oceanispirochaeta sp. M1]RDG29630.1 hypothetical protein DV872_20655 [Oceanispirochaeta sp. M1]